MKGGMGQDDGARTVTAQYGKMHSSAHSIIKEEGSERGSAASSLPLKVVFSNMKHSRGSSINALQKSNSEQSIAEHS
jgi:hypothetical protein